MKFLTTLSLVLIPLFIFAEIRGDSLNYLTAQDSVFLTVDESNQKIIEHRFAEKQTVYSLAKFYGLELNELMYYNSEIEKPEDISIGTIIKVPIPNKAIKRYKTKDFVDAEHASIYYKVKGGDNLFHICKRLFRMPIEDIQKRNNIQGNNIKPGQLLHVGWMSISGVPREFRKLKPVPPEWQASQLLGLDYLRAKGIKPERTQRGVAAWNKNSKNVNDIFALHTSAPINSIIGVTNPMSKRTLYVKVIGRPSSKVYYGTNVVVVLSKKAAQMLGARNTRFYVNVKYLR
ncbi:MAG: LysM peptidoglycan-binding domain-containing protein [Bacteroidota bacterium]